MGKETGNSKIQDLFNEVELFRRAVRDARDALATAEQELDETLDAEYGKTENSTDG